MKLAIVTSHPIQYNAPWFRMLHQRGNVQVKAFYTWQQAQDGPKFDHGFGKKLEWDIPLLDGYEYTFVKNIAKDPGSHHYKGLDNPTLIAEIEQWKPTAILVITWAHKSHLQCMRYFHKKVPILFRGDSTLLNERPGVKKIIRTLFLRWVYSKVDYPLYVGTNNRNYYLRHGFKPEQLVYAPHAIDNDRFSANEHEYRLSANEWREKLHIAADDIVFLFAGKLEEVKNPELLLDAFSAIKDEHVHLVMVGNGLKEQQLKEQYGKLTNLHFVDFQNQTQMPVMYNLSDVFVLSSRSETWGLAINEAMACKRAVLVSSKCGAAVDLVEQGKNGYVFESENLQDLVAKMRTLVERKDDLKVMGENSYNKIQDFSFTKICAQLEQLLKKINKK